MHITRIGRDEKTITNVTFVAIKYVMTTTVLIYVIFVSYNVQIVCFSCFIRIHNLYLLFDTSWSVVVLTSKLKLATTNRHICQDAQIYKWLNAGCMGLGVQSSFSMLVVNAT